MATEHQKGKVEKTMHEFKEGTLHSGSKKGPEVTSRKQAIAIALNQAGLSKYEDGINFVPKTGPAILHKGEAVIPAKDNKMASANPFDRITEGDKSKKPPKHIREIRTRRSHDGKLIHTHVHHHPEHHPDEDHVSEDMGALHNHFEDHAGTPNMGEETPASGGPAPLTAAAPPMPAPSAMGA